MSTARRLAPVILLSAALAVLAVAANGRLYAWTSGQVYGSHTVGECLNTITNFQPAKCNSAGFCAGLMSGSGSCADLSGNCNDDGPAYSKRTYSDIRGVGNCGEYTAGICSECKLVCAAGDAFVPKDGVDCGEARCDFWTWDLDKCRTGW